MDSRNSGEALREKTTILKLLNLRAFYTCSRRETRRDQLKNGTIQPLLQNQSNMNIGNILIIFL